MRKFLQLQSALSIQLQRVKAQLSSDWHNVTSSIRLEPAQAAKIQSLIEDTRLSLEELRDQLDNLRQTIERLDSAATRLPVEHRNELRQIVSSAAETIARLEVRINAECCGAEGALRSALAHYHPSLLTIRRSMTEFDLAATKELDMDSFEMP